MEIKNTAVRFGYAAADITPDWPVELVGFARLDNTSQGIFQPLYAQILLCQTDHEKCCLITIDSIGFTVNLTQKLRDLVAAELQSGRAKVMVCFSHTHSAPNAGTDERYYQLVCDRVLAAVREAQGNMEQWNAAWAVTETNIGVNRRGENSVLDNRLGILKLADGISGEPKLLVLRVTAHANVLTSDNYRISADYFGPARERLAEKYGCKVMMIQGASGDVRPRYQQENAEYLEIHAFEASMKSYSDVEKERYFQQSMAALAQMANSIVQSVAGVLEEMVPAPVFRLTMFSEHHRFWADVPGLERAAQIAAEAQKEAAIDGRDWLQEVKRLHQDKIQAQEAKIEFQYFILNDGCLCGVPNEAMCEIALDIARRAQNPLVFFGGYVNGIDSYLPTAQEYDKGGYEVLWSNLVYFRYHGRVMPLNRNTARNMADIVAASWASLNHRASSGE
jgi:hypothetical protein